MKDALLLNARADVASRGLDIPHVDIEVNYHIPTQGPCIQSWETARAERAGEAVTFVSHYDVELFQMIEQLLG